MKELEADTQIAANQKERGLSKSSSKPRPLSAPEPAKRDLG